MNIFTIGFTKKNASDFFLLLRDAGIKTLFDVRTNNSSQLAGFAKKQDLKFFVNEILGAQYEELRELCPDPKLLKTYRDGQMGWDAYAERYLDGLARRNVERAIPLSTLENGCLLCSEHEPLHCHRRLALEYLGSFAAHPPKVVHLL